MIWTEKNLVLSALASTDKVISRRRGMRRVHKHCGNVWWWWFLYSLCLCLCNTKWELGLKFFVRLERYLVRAFCNSNRKLGIICYCTSSVCVQLRLMRVRVNEVVFSSHSRGHLDAIQHVVMWESTYETSSSSRRVYSVKKKVSQKGTGLWAYGTGGFSITIVFENCMVEVGKRAPSVWFFKG